MARVRYARGTNALAECQRSGKRVPYRDLVEDGHIPGLLVAPDWWEPRHPQEDPPSVKDPVALFRPSPEHRPPGEGEVPAPDIGVEPMFVTIGPGVVEDA